MELGAPSAGAVDVDDAGGDEELRRESHVASGREVRPTALSDPKGRP